VPKLDGSVPLSNKQLNIADKWEGRTMVLRQT